MIDELKAEASDLVDDDIVDKGIKIIEACEVTHDADDTCYDGLMEIIALVEPVIRDKVTDGVLEIVENKYTDRSTAIAQIKELDLLDNP